VSRLQSTIQLQNSLKKMYKVSPSLIDKFLSIRAGLFDKPVDELIAYIKGEGVTSKQMSFGTEVHKFIETGNAELFDIEKEQLQPFYEMYKSFPKEIRTRVELFPGITMSLVADQLVGNVVHEFKTGDRFWGVDMYDRSIQWKIYCQVFEAPKVVYHHFQYNKSQPDKPAIFSYCTFSFFAYPKMKEDIKYSVDDFINFVIINGLEKYITI
jgi:hypothetical protein